MAVSSSDGSDANNSVYVYTGSLHERRVPEGVTKVVCRGDVKVIRSAAFDEMSHTACPLPSPVDKFSFHADGCYDPDEHKGDRAERLNEGLVEIEEGESEPPRVQKLTTWCTP